MKRDQGIMRQIGLVLILAMLSVVVLSAAGIYALMSFTVARRRREIGIRAALGADPTRVLAGIFARALGQLGLGTAVGLAGAVALESIIEGVMFQGRGIVIVPIVILFMIDGRRACGDRSRPTRLAHPADRGAARRVNPYSKLRADPTT